MHSFVFFVTLTLSGLKIETLESFNDWKSETQKHLYPLSLTKQVGGQDKSSYCLLYVVWSWSRLSTKPLFFPMGPEGFTDCVVITQHLQLDSICNSVSFSFCKFHLCSGDMYRYISSYQGLPPPQITQSLRNCHILTHHHSLLNWFLQTHPSYC